MPIYEPIAPRSTALESHSQQEGQLFSSQKSSTLQKMERNSRFSLAKAFAGLTAIVGIAMHFLGKVSNDVYLSTVGVSPELFPKSVDWMAVNGYYTMFDRALKATITLIGSLKILGLVVGGIFFVVLYIYFLEFMSERTASNFVKERFSRLSNWKKESIKVVWKGITTASMIPLIFVWTTLLWGVPGYLGETRGISKAEQDLKMFAKGCDHAPVRRKCVNLQKVDKLIARGFLIDSSESHIAIFDVNLNKPRVLALEGMEIISDSSSIEKAP